MIPYFDWRYVYEEENSKVLSCQHLRRGNFLLYGGCRSRLVCYRERKFFRLCACFCACVYLAFVVYETLNQRYISKYRNANNRCMAPLAPYMVAIGVFLLLFLVNILKDWLPLPEMLYYIIDEGFLKFGLAFLLPVSYSVIMLCCIFDFSYLVFYSAAILYSILHMLAIAVLFIQQIKKNAGATPRE